MIEKLSDDNTNECVAISERELEESGNKDRLASIGDQNLQNIKATEDISVNILLG